MFGSHHLYQVLLFVSSRIIVDLVITVSKTPLPPAKDLVKTKALSCISYDNTKQNRILNGTEHEVVPPYVHYVVGEVHCNFQTDVHKGKAIFSWRMLLSPAIKT